MTSFAETPAVATAETPAVATVLADMPSSCRGFGTCECILLLRWPAKELRLN